MYTTGIACLLYYVENATRGKSMDKKIRMEVEGSRLLSGQALTYSGAAWRLPFRNDTILHGGHLGWVVLSCVAISPSDLQDLPLHECTVCLRKPHSRRLRGG